MKFYDLKPMRFDAEQTSALFSRRYWPSARVRSGERQTRSAERNQHVDSTNGRRGATLVCCPLSVVCCLLSVVRCPLSVVCCLLSVVRCPLSVVCCLLSVVCCPLQRSIQSDVIPLGVRRTALLLQTDN